MAEQAAASHSNDARHVTVIGQVAATLRGRSTTGCSLISLMNIWSRTDFGPELYCWFLHGGCDVRAEAHIERSETVSELFCDVFHRSANPFYRLLGHLCEIDGSHPRRHWKWKPYSSGTNHQHFGYPLQRSGKHWHPADQQLLRHAIEVSWGSPESCQYPNPATDPWQSSAAFNL